MGLSIADICFLFGGYVVWRKLSDVFACQGHRSSSRSFSEGFKSTR